MFTLAQRLFRRVPKVRLPTYFLTFQLMVYNCSSAHCVLTKMVHFAIRVSTALRLYIFIKVHLTHIGFRSQFRLLVSYELIVAHGVKVFTRTWQVFDLIASMHLSLVLVPKCVVLHSKRRSLKLNFTSATIATLNFSIGLHFANTCCFMASPRKVSTIWTTQLLLHQSTMASFGLQPASSEAEELKAKYARTTGEPRTPFIPSNAGAVPSGASHAEQDEYWNTKQAPVTVPTCNDSEAVVLVAKQTCKLSRQVAALRQVIFKVWILPSTLPFMVAMETDRKAFEEAQKQLMPKQKSEQSHLGTRLWLSMLEAMYETYKDDQSELFGLGPAQTFIGTLNAYKTHALQVTPPRLYEEVMHFKVVKAYRKETAKLEVMFSPGSPSAVLWYTHVCPVITKQKARPMTNCEPKGDLERRIQTWLDSKQSWSQR